MGVRYLKQGEHKFKAYGYKVVVPDELSYIIRINAKWQGEEENMRFALFTTGQWNDFSESEEESQEFAFGGDFHNHIKERQRVCVLCLSLIIHLSIKNRG